MGLIVRSKESLTSQDVFNERLRRHFPSFVEWAFGVLHPGECFTPTWHHKAIFHQLNRAWRGETKRLVASLAPRSLKSFIISVAFPAWILARDPTRKIMCVSYGESLSEKLAQDCRKLMQHKRYQDAFPDSKLETLAVGSFTTIMGGGRLSAPFGGGLTGHGADLIIMDDPIKASDAKSEVMRKAVLDFYHETLASRLNNKKDGIIILLMQRLHEQDLAGTLIVAGGWDELTLPAIAPCDTDIPIGKGKFHHRKIGDVLDPIREPYETLMEIRRDLGPSVFSAQYLCAPLPDEGAMIRRDWLRYYDNLPNSRPGDIILQSWDCANTVSETSDWSVGLTFLLRDDQIYLIGHCRARLLFPMLKARVEQEIDHFKPSILLIEDAAAGQQLIQVFNETTPPGFPTIYAIKPKGEKENRVARATLEIERGHLFLPRDAAYLPTLQREMLSFPQSLHDDQVDALAQALNFVAERRLLGDIAPLGNMRFSPWIGDRGSDDEFYDPDDDPDEIAEEDM